MSSVVIYGLVLSVAMAIGTIVLFRHEQKRGIRFADKTRRHADFFVLKIVHSIHVGLRYVGRDAMRQIFYYVFHTILSFVLKCIKRWEDGLREAIRSNKTIAREAERESVTLTKLEEIALHKVENELSEEEKQTYRRRALEGK